MEALNCDFVIAADACCKHLRVIGISSAAACSSSIGHAWEIWFKICSEVYLVTIDLQSYGKFRKILFIINSLFLIVQQHLFVNSPLHRNYFNWNQQSSKTSNFFQCYRCWIFRAILSVTRSSSFFGCSNVWVAAVFVLHRNKAIRYVDNKRVSTSH